MLQLTSDALSAATAAPHVTSITITSDPALTHVPPLTLTFSHLRSLNLTGDALVSLPWNVSNLTALTSLVASRNQINALPSELGLLTQVSLIWDMARMEGMRGMHGRCRAED